MAGEDSRFLVAGWRGALLILIRCLFSNKHVLAQKCKILFRVVALIVLP